MLNSVIKDGFVITPEMKQNYVLLLSLRYMGNISYAASVFGIDPEKLREYEEMYKQDIQQYLPNSDSVPSPDEIMEKGLRRLNDMIELATDPQKITSAMKVVNEMKSANRRNTAESVYDKINKLILGEDYINEKGNI